MVYVSELLLFRKFKRECERQYVELLLRRVRGNCSEAARLADKDRRDFYDLMRRCRVKPGRFRGAARRDSA